MSVPQEVVLANSHKVTHSGQISSHINRDEVITVTLRIRRKKSIEPRLETDGYITQEDYEKEYGASPEDVKKVEAFAHQYHLNIVETSLARRSVILSGSITDMEKAFGLTLSASTGADGSQIRVRDGDIYIPRDLKNIIEGVFGLDNRPAARPMLKVATRDGQNVTHAQAPQALTPVQAADIYGFPQGDGTGQTIGILELGGGFREEDITAYFTGQAIKAPAIKTILVGGGVNNPTNSSSLADREVMLDIAVAGSIAPGANLVIYFCTNTDDGFLNGITTAIHDHVNKPSVLSISWASAEEGWTGQSMNSINEAFKAASVLGVTVCVASGDNGSNEMVGDGKVHVAFPASSPFVLACGGTSLTVTNNKVSREVVWNDGDNSASGGGVSNFFPLPGYQAKAKVPLSLDTKFKGRGVPDVAANADSDIAYKVLVDGVQLVIGGTSAVAPLMAGLIARVNQQKGKLAGFINPGLYADPSLCRDITEGDNKTTPNKTGYSARAGWDGCTGLGVLSKF